MLRRGDINQPGKVAVPGTLSCVTGLPARFAIKPGDDESASRAALARWISDRKNPLTWRSIVNRVWHYHFGRGLVATPSDFGRMGASPSHPELLDWLAAKFLESGGFDQGASSLDRHERGVPPGAPAALPVKPSRTPITSGSGDRIAAGSTPNRSTTRSSRSRAGSTRSWEALPCSSFIRARECTSRRWLIMRRMTGRAPGRPAQRLPILVPNPARPVLRHARFGRRLPAHGRAQRVDHRLQALTLLNNPFVICECKHMARRLNHLCRMWPGRYEP